MRFLHLLPIALFPVLASAQIELVRSFDVTTSGLVPRDLVPMGDVLYFRSWTAEQGMELWRSDGTPEGTYLVKDIGPGPASGLLANDGMVAVGDTLYFAANDGVTGPELWKSDGTEAGTALVRDIYPGPVGSQPVYLTPFGNRLFLRAATDDGMGGTLHIKDDLMGGVNQLLSAATEEVMVVGGPITVLGSVALFPGSPGNNGGTELWLADGTLWGCYLVNDICAGSTSGFNGGFPMVSDGFMYFVANDCTHGFELWRTDGSGALTTMVADVYPGPESALPYNTVALDDHLVFAALDGDGNGLYSSDGTAIGTARISTIYVPNWSIGYRQTARRVGDQVLFAGNDNVNGAELWRSDGTASGTALVKDIFPGSNGSIGGNGTPFVVIDDLLYFAPEVPLLGVELWQSDGTETGTFMVQDRALGANFFAPDYMMRMGDHIYMTGQQTDFDRGIYRMQAPGAAGIATATSEVGKLSAYPNPAIDAITVVLPSEVGSGPLDVQVMDALGRTWNVIAARSAERRLMVPLANLASGAYVLSIRQGQGPSYWTRVVVERGTGQ